ncbi:MAG: biotin/lipoyl-binding protein [Lachnospiraceae bacterium]|nr:biotin/lipoyl-binding protein [Lachnospiraceae bacterium]
MKNYVITVNGVSYDVTVEEGTSGNNVVKTQAPKAAPAVKPAAPVQSGNAGSVKVQSPMPGKILSVKVKVGQAVKKGEVLMILEAMKMENEVVAAQDGTIASINVNDGASVESGDVLATMN